jgi:hypothetical protein
MLVQPSKSTLWLHIKGGWQIFRGYRIGLTTIIITGDICNSSDFRAKNGENHIYIIDDDGDITRWSF